MARKAIFQVVGYKNSGKTTLIEQLTQACRKESYSVGTIKHHGHGGKPASPFIEKDTDQHRRAGANVVAVEGAGSLYIEAEQPLFELDNIIDIYTHFSLDIIFIEGFKYEHYPKVVLLRNKLDESLLYELTNIQAVICSEPIAIKSSYPVYMSEDTDLFIHSFIHSLKK